MMSIIDLHPFRHTISTVAMMAQIAPMIRKIAARTVKVVGTRYGLCISKSMESWRVLNRNEDI